MEKTISRVLFNQHGLTITSSMKLPDVQLNRAYNSISITGLPCIYIRKVGQAQELSPYYVITVDNIYDTVVWLNTVLDWFYSDKYNDLFIYDDNNIPILNLDFKDMYVDTYRRSNTDQIMRAYPAIVTTKSFGMTEKGINLMINRTENATLVPLASVKKIYSQLVNYSFQNEISALINMVSYAKMTNSLQIKSDQNS